MIMHSESAKQTGDEMKRNKRKHETEDESESSPKKKQRLHLPNISSQHPFDSTSNSPSLCTQYTSNHILNDTNLYLTTNNDEEGSEEQRSDGFNLNYSTHSSPITRRLLDPLSRVSQFKLESDSIASCSSSIIYRISENSLSVLFKYLSVNDVLCLSKTNSVFWRLSFKLLTCLTVYCKTIYGINDSSINNLLSRCSFYLSYLDLSHIGSIVSDVTLDIIGIHCFQLKNISFHGCCRITDNGLIALLSSCKWIRQLDISGCAQITSSIGPALSLSHHLNSLNIAWCTEVDCNIIPYLIYLNVHHSLRNTNIHCINKFVTLFPCFKYVMDSISINYKLKDKLFIIGGLQQKTMNSDNLIQQINYLESVGIHYVNPESINLRSISEYDFKHKLDLLIKSQNKIKNNGYRVYAADNTDKIYVVINTKNGVFGTKLLPNKDFNGERNEYIDLLIKSGRNPIQYLESECNIKNWKWIREFQSKRRLSLLGMHKNANWIKMTAPKHCPQINAFIQK